MKKDIAPEFVEFAHSLADGVRRLVTQYFRKPFSIDEKQDDSPVTVADREIENYLRAMIKNKFPDHGVIGEEYGEEKTGAKYVWVLDPIDGTRSFVTGTPTFGTLISLLSSRVSVVGIIDMPVLGERWMGVSGHPTKYNDTVCSVSTCNQINSCRLVTTSQEMFSESQLESFKRVQAMTGFYRYSGDCYNYGLLASGFVDLVVEADLKAYDFCALVPVVENAGGVITDWQGNPLTLASKGDVVAAATHSLHQQAIHLLNQGSQ